MLINNRFSETDQETSFLLRKKIKILLVSRLKFFFLNFFLFCFVSIDTEALSTHEDQQNIWIPSLTSSCYADRHVLVFNDTYNGLSYIPVLRLVSGCSKQYESTPCVKQLHILF